VLRQALPAACWPLRRVWRVARQLVVTGRAVRNSGKLYIDEWASNSAARLRS
jgi:hypothetical protein